MSHEDAVLIAERHHVGHQPERGQSDRVHQDFAQFGRDLFGPARPLRHRPRELERNARPGQVAKRVWGWRRQPRVNQNRGRGQKRPVQPHLHFVVVGDDQFQPYFTRDFRFGQAGDSAVHADDERNAGLSQFANLLAVQPVALGKSQRNVELHVRAEFAEHAEEDRCAGHTVYVVVAVNADAPLVGHGLCDSLGGGLHTRQRLGRV